MGNSLRDALLEAGLVGEKQSQESRGRKRGKSRPSRKQGQTSTRVPEAGEHSSTDSAVRATARHALRENQRRTARFVRDPTLAGESLAESARKALRRKIRELVERERLNHAQAEIPYHFVKGKRVKRIYVTEHQREQLGRGEIVIAALDGDHHLLAAAAAEALHELTPQTVLCAAAEADADSDEHPVPDDITW